MSGTIWPVDAMSGAPSYTGRMLREAALTVLAGGATAARPFGGKSGVRPGTSTAIGSMSGLNYTITPFGGLIDGEASTLAGVYGFAFPGNETGTINAQTGTARTDLLSVVINDPAEGDAGLPSVKIVYTAGPSPVSPGHGFDLYQVNVPATGGGSPTLSWVGPVSFAAGGIPRVPNQASRDATFPSPQQGDQVERDDLGYRERYYAAYNSSTNPAGAKNAGWFPAAGGSVMPGGLQVRSATAQALTSGGYTLLPAAFYSESLAGASHQQGLSTPFATNGGYKVDVDGVYDVSFFANLSVGSGGLIVIKKNDATASQSGQVLATTFPAIAGASPASLQGRIALLAGDILRVALYCASGSTITANPVDALFGIRYVEPIRA